ncbi:unnamed protein product [Dibothriocephalus latus]|uniref:Uncharacterized protein n=1 Tax=Dibothriocephalus latus TaxID=60516 RepID=A0A3P7PG55_DIBLA|nr:unnamed protein product [Dibothriocephalus latus]
MSSDHSYLMTCAGDAIYVVKRELSAETADQDPPLIDLQDMDPAMRV